MDKSLNNYMDKSLNTLEKKLDSINIKLDNNTIQRQQLIESHQLLVRMIIELRDKIRDIEIQPSKVIK